MKKIHTLAIVGSQRWLTTSGEIHAKFCLAAAVTFIEPTLLISGGCPQGVDHWVEEEWLERSTTPQLWQPGFSEYPAAVQEWDPPTKNGYKARNIEIAEACDALISIRSTTSKTYGSGWTADYAEKLGKKVWRFEFS